MLRGWSRLGTGIARGAGLASAVACALAASATASVPSPSGVVVGGVPHVYYVGADRQLRQLYRSARWIDQDLARFVSGAEPAAPGSSPKALRDRGGDQHVYYPGANGEMWQYVWNGRQWFIQDLAGFVTGAEPVAGGSSPATTLDFSGAQHVYYAGANGQMWQYVWDGSQWFDQQLAALVPAAEPFASGTSPSVLLDPSGGEHVYYVGANGDIWQYSWNGKSWLNQDVAGFVSGGEPAAAGSSPSVLLDRAGDQHVYYAGANGQMWQYVWDGSHWTDQELSGFVGGRTEPVASATSPSVLLDPGGGQHAYYAGANGQVWQYSWTGSRWLIQDLAGFSTLHEPVQAGGSPDAVPYGNDEYEWYAGAEARVWQWLWNGRRWSDTDLGGLPWSPQAAALAVGTTTVAAPPRPGHVDTKLKLSWTWRGAHTRVHRIWAVGAPTGRSFTFSCRGAACPRAADARHARRSLRALSGLRFRAGDRLELTVYAPGLRAERFDVRFRFRRKPAGRVL